MIHHTPVTPQLRLIIVLLIKMQLQSGKPFAPCCRKCFQFYFNFICLSHCHNLPSVGFLILHLQGIFFIALSFPFNVQLFSSCRIILYQKIHFRIYFQCTDPIITFCSLGVLLFVNKIRLIIYNRIVTKYTVFAFFFNA